MVSSYSSLLRLELIGTSDQSGQWGVTTNDNLGGLVEQAIAGGNLVTHDDTPNFTLSTNNGGVDQARSMILNIEGTLTADRNVVCPDTSKLYVVANNTVGGFSLTLKTAAGSGVAVPNGETRLCMVGAAGVRLAHTTAVNELSGVLNISKGGTGAATGGGALTNFGGGAAGIAAFKADTTVAALQTLKTFLNAAADVTVDSVLTLDDRGAVLAVDATGGDVDLTLLLSATAGDAFSVTVVRTDNSANAVTVVASGSDTVNGDATLQLGNVFDGVTLFALPTAEAWLAFPFGSFESFLRPNVGTSVTADIGPQQQVLVDQATIAWDVTKGASARVTIDADREVGAPTGIIDGHSYVLVVEVGAGGSHTVTAWDSIFVFSDAGQPVLPATAGSKVAVGFIADGGTLLSVYVRFVV